MDNSSQRNEPRGSKYVWPWFLLAAIILAVALAIAWMTFAVLRLRHSREPWSQPSASQTSSALAKTNNPKSTPTQSGALAGFQDLLSGGHAEAGQKIFFEKPEASCGKCHKAGGQGGETGPSLNGIGAKQTREQILESILRPNQKTSEGYESVILLLKNGTGCSGFLKNENESELHVLTPEDGLVTIRKSDVQVRQKGLSPMPEGLDQILPRADLRDLVEFVSSLKP